MQVLDVDLDGQGFPVLNTYITKEGSRREWKLSLDDNFVQSISKQLPIDKPLRFASLMEALPTDGPSQHLHHDSENSDQVNAIVYLTDVLKEDNGPIEFTNGPILGPRGTTVIYNANEMHRGRANHSSVNRVALTLAFAESDNEIRTIGAEPPPDNSWRWKLALGIAAGLIVLFMLYRRR